MSPRASAETRSYPRAKPPQLTLSIEALSSFNFSLKPPKAPMLKDNFSADCSTLKSGETGRYFFAPSPLWERMDEREDAQPLEVPLEDVEEMPDLVQAGGQQKGGEVAVEVSVHGGKEALLKNGMDGDEMATNLRRSVAWIGIAGQGGLPCFAPTDDKTHLGEGGLGARRLLIVRDEYNDEGMLISRLCSKL